MNAVRIVRPQGLRALTSLSLATIYRLIKRGDFPRPIQLSVQAVGWDVNDINAWIEGRKTSQLREVAL